MRLLARAALCVLWVGPASAADMALMVGLRSTIAAYIRDYGYRCSDVTTFESAGYAGDGEILKVICAPRGEEERIYRVVAYMDGEFEARPWPQENASRP